MTRTTTFIALALVLATATHTTAQEDDGTGFDLAAWVASTRPQHALAQICAHEDSFPIPDTGDFDEDGDTTEWINQRHTHGWGADCALHHEVLLRGAVRRSGRVTRQAYLEFAYSYSDRVFNPSPDSARRWVSHLPDGDTTAIPEGWPVEWERHGDMLSARTTWARRHRNSWTHAREVAAELYRHTLVDIEEWSACDQPVDDWGGDMDRHNAERIGLVAAECTDTSNTGYARPSQIEARTRACEEGTPGAECWWWVDPE